METEDSYRDMLEDASCQDGRFASGSRDLLSCALCWLGFYYASVCVK